MDWRSSPLHPVLVLVCLLIVVLCCPSSAQYGGGQQASKAKAFMYYQQGLQAYQMGDLTAAVAFARKARALDSRNKFACLLEAQAEADSGDNYNANNSFRAALTLDYNFVDARNAFGMYLQKTGKADEAKKQFLECIKINPKYPYAYHHLGQLLKDKGDLDAAIENMDTACQLKPDYWEAQRDLGLTMFERCQTGDIAQAMEKLLIAVKLVPDNPMIHYYLGTIYCAEARLDDAEAEFRRTLMIDAKHAAAHWELARLRYFRGDLDRCLSETREALKISPVYTEGKKYPKVEEPTLKFIIARCLELKGKMIPAVDAWKDFAPMTPFYSAAAQHIADIEKKLRKEAKKKAKPLPYDPEEIDALVAKGIGQYDDGDLEGAKASFQRALELNPQCFEAMQNTGACLEAMGDLNGAMAKYQAAMAMKPEFDGAYYNMAYLLEKLNLPADAGMMYEKFHEISGTYPYDPKHIVALQQEDARQRARADQLKKRGY